MHKWIECFSQEWELYELSSRALFNPMKIQISRVSLVAAVHTIDCAKHHKWDCYGFSSSSSCVCVCVFHRISFQTDARANALLEKPLTPRPVPLVDSWKSRVWKETIVRVWGSWYSLSGELLVKDTQVRGNGALAKLQVD